MRRASRLIPLVVVVALIAAAAPARAGDGGSIVGAKLGSAQMSKTDGQVVKKDSAQVVGAEYLRFVGLGTAFFLGYRQANDARTQQSSYLAAYGGGRMYPLGVGRPRTGTAGDAEVRIDASFKPYVDLGVSLGRARFQPLGVGELSADIVGANVGFGMSWYVADRFALDTGAVAEQFQSRGGANTLALAGTNIYVLLGLGDHF